MRSRLRFHTCIILCTVLLLSIPAILLGKSVIVAIGKEKPPYIHGATQTGLIVDVLRESFAEQGLDIQIRHLPNIRLQSALLIMSTIDAAAGVVEEDDGLYYSDDFMSFENYAITRSFDQIPLNEVTDLKGHSIVAWQNAWRNLGPEMQMHFSPFVRESHTPRYYEIPSQEIQHRLFFLGRTDIILADRTIFHWYRKTLSNQVDTTTEVTFHKLFGNASPFKVAFRSKLLRDMFNKGLKALKKSGRYTELREGYLR